MHMFYEWYGMVWNGMVHHALHIFLRLVFTQNELMVSVQESLHLQPGFLFIFSLSMFLFLHKRCTQEQLKGLLYCPGPDQQVKCFCPEMQDFSIKLNWDPKTNQL